MDRLGGLTRVDRSIGTEGAGVYRGWAPVGACCVNARSHVLPWILVAQDVQFAVGGWRCPDRPH